MSGSNPFSEDDLKSIAQRGMRLEDVLSQIDRFQHGFPFSRLIRPCTVGDGINVLDSSEEKRLSQIYSTAAQSGRVTKFVPASGAASRMFKDLISYLNRLSADHSPKGRGLKNSTDRDDGPVRDFIAGIKKFAFYDDLKSALSKQNACIESLISEGNLKPIIETLLAPPGLNLAGTPKGLIKFHRYPDHIRSAFEEHLVEAASLVADNQGIARIHFTVSPEHQSAVSDHINQWISRHKESMVTLAVTLSTQHPRSDSLAVDLNNQPMRDNAGKLIFRPGGHGALLENINALNEDIIFLKNIDNVVPEKMLQETISYKRLLGGLLIDLQDRIFDSLDRLIRQKWDEDHLEEIQAFVKKWFTSGSEFILDVSSGQSKADALFHLLNRPLRVCGMVRNQGEPGGGPFWVDNDDGPPSVQIVESSQVDMASPQQKTIWAASTHFNPVDLVCGVRDFRGKPFDLMAFTDPTTGFITVKSKAGRALKSLELPGLWNGAMAQWNTVFIEVPITTFNPVKTIFDLLRDEHQAS